MGKIWFILNARTVTETIRDLQRAVSWNTLGKSIQLSALNCWTDRLRLQKIIFRKKKHKCTIQWVHIYIITTERTVRSNQSFSNIDNKDFHNILQYLKKDLSIISRQTLMRRLKDRYELGQNNLKDLFRTVKSKFSITCDIWSSLNQLSFFGVTVH